MKKIILTLVLMLTLTLPSFARGLRFYIQVYPTWEPEPFCSTPYMYGGPQVFYPYPYGTIYQPWYPPVIILPGRSFAISGGRFIR